MQQVLHLGLLLASAVSGIHGWQNVVDRQGGGKRHAWGRRRTNEDKDGGAFEAVCPMVQAEYVKFPNGSMGFVHKCPDIWYRNSTIKLKNTDYYQGDNSLEFGGDIKLYNMEGFSEGLGTSNGTAYVENLLIRGEWGFTNTNLVKKKQPTPLAWPYEYMANNISKLHKPQVNAQCTDGTPGPDYPAEECEILKKTSLECPGPEGQRNWCGMVKMKNLRVRMLYRFDLGRVYETVHGDSKDSPSLCRYWDFVYTDSTKAPLPGREDMNLFLSMGDTWYNIASNLVGHVSFDDYPCTPGTGFEDHSCLHRISTNYIYNRDAVPYYVNAGDATLSLPSRLGIYGRATISDCSDERGEGLAGLNCPEVSMDVSLMGTSGGDFSHVSKAAKFKRSYQYWSYDEDLGGSLTAEDLEPPSQCINAMSI